MIDITDIIIKILYLTIGFIIGYTIATFQHIHIINKYIDKIEIKLKKI
jgi:hypothetical protein